MINYDYGIVLLPINSKDAELLQYWRNDYKVWKYSRQSGLISDMMQARWIESQDKNPATQMFLIVKDDGEKIGVCGFTGIDHINRTAEISIYIAPEHQKQGLATPAFRTLMAHGFYNLGFNSIYCECFVGNKVISIVERVGFVPYGVKRESYFKDGKFIDSQQFVILRKESEWAG